MRTTIAIIKITWKRLVPSTFTIVIFYIGLKSYNKFKEIESVVRGILGKIWPKGVASDQGRR